MSIDCSGGAESREGRDTHEHFETSIERFVPYNNGNPGKSAAIGSGTKFAEAYREPGAKRRER